MAKRDYYEVLGVAKSADDAELKRRVAVKMLHPTLVDDEVFLKRFLRGFRPDAMIHRQRRHLAARQPPVLRGQVQQGHRVRPAGHRHRNRRPVRQVNTRQKRLG